MIGYGTGWMRMTTVLQAFLLIKTVHGLCTGCGQLQPTQIFTAGIPIPLPLSGNGNCYVIDGVQISGSVEVSGGARLVVQSGASISGSIEASGALTSVSLMSATVTGEVIMSNGAGALCVDDDTTTEDLKVEDSGSVRVEGTVSSVEVALSTGDIELVGATVLGGVLVKETTGDLVINSQSSVGGPIGVAKGTGNVMVSDVNLTQVDLRVEEQDGDVIIESASLSDILVEKSTTTMATISLVKVTTMDDTKLKQNTGADVFLADCTIGGDTLIEENGDVHIESSVFFGNILKNSGAVRITDCNFLNLSVDDNTGAVTINYNTGNSLNCSNNGQVLGTGNTIALLSCPPL